VKAADVYSRLGWRLVPLHSAIGGVCSCGKTDCPSAGKHPRLNAWQREASNDPAQLARWSEQWPLSNLGVATGDASGFFVLDVDPENGGLETLGQLEAEHGTLPVTPRARTGSGGFHYLFSLPGFAVTNSAGKLGRGLDTRGNGGQIVVAPSVSAKGKYVWVAPPWRTPLADAPAWLLAALSRPSTASKPGASPTNRGFFPAAPPEVLEAARAALDAHGPAIDGDGGGLHTVQAAAILTHDFALTDAEALPLLLEWNETCQPPWEPEGLTIMLSRGRKYGKADYGSRRSMDAVQAAQKLIVDWQAAPAEPAMFKLIEDVRELARVSADPSKRAVIERDLSAATGIAGRSLALPPPTVSRAPVTAGEIEVTTRIHEVADKSIAAISGKVFQRNGVLCEVVKQERTFISDLETARIQDLMSAASKYVRADEKLGTVAQVAPIAAATILCARRTHSVRVLEAVTTAPVFLADGSILQARGYNAAARVFLEPSVAVDVPDDPSQDDARAAVSVFARILGGYSFASPADFSSWLAALLSPLVKAATANAPAPLFCISASSPGAGKTLLADVIAQIITGGRNVENSPYNPRDIAEWGKRLTSFVKAAAAVRAFDNVTTLGDENLDRLLTASIWSDRILGGSESPPLPIVTTWLATGNNIEPRGDTVRRVLMVRLEVLSERPQERDGWAYDLAGGYALKHRGELLSAALTILRAFHVAGRPPQSLPSWGSFSDWSHLIRGALVWAGCADPFLTQRRASLELNEPENEAHDFWIGIIDGSDGLAGTIAATANKRDAQSALGLRETITSHTLPNLLRRFIDKPRGGRRIRRDRGTYVVEALPKASRLS